MLNAIYCIKFFDNAKPITTAFSEYALDGYEWNVLDYLLKPIPYERFLKAIQKASVLFQEKERAPQETCIFVKSDGNLMKVNPASLFISKV